MPDQTRPETDQTAQSPRHKTALVVALCIAGIAIAVCVGLLFYICQLKTYQDEELGATAPPAVVDVRALMSLNQSWTLSRYAVRYFNPNADDFLYYVFAGKDDVSVYEETYPGEIIDEVTATYASASDDHLYLFCMDYGELYFERGDIYGELDASISDEQADEILREVMQLHGLPTGNLVFGGRAGESLSAGSESAFYYDLQSVDGVPFSSYNLGVFAMLDGPDVVCLSYTNIDAGSMTPTGAPCQTLTGAQAAQVLLDLPEDYLALYDYGDLTFEKAELVYDVVRVKGDASKGVLTPLWELTSQNGIIFQIDAITGALLDGASPYCFTQAQWAGQWE